MFPLQILIKYKYKEYFLKKILAYIINSNHIIIQILLPLLVFDVGFVSEVPIIIKDEPELNRSFRPGIFINMHKL